MKENKNIILEFRRDFDKYVTSEKNTQQQYQT